MLKLGEAVMAKLLVLSGTAYVGRNMVGAALAAGCEVTLLDHGTREAQFAQTVALTSQAEAVYGCEGSRGAATS